MKKKQQQEELSRQEDQALMRGMLWAAGAMVLEGLLFVLNRYAFHYEATLESVLLAEKMRALLSVLTVVGLVAFVAGIVLAVLGLKKGGNTLWSGVLGVVGLVVMICGYVAGTYHESGMRMLYLLVPVLGALAACYYIYPRDFFVSALPAVAAVLGLWFARADGIGIGLIATVLVCVVVLLVVLKLKKGDGMVELVGQSLRVMEEKTNYTVPMASAAAALAVLILAAVAGGTIAYYLIFVMSAWLFALLVYYTVKML